MSEVEGSIYQVDRKKPCPFCYAEMRMVSLGMEHPRSRLCPLSGVFIGKKHQLYERWNNRRKPVKE